MTKLFLFATALLSLLWTVIIGNSPVFAARPTRDEPVRIVSLDGTVSEILCDLGLQSHIIGVDVTSTYPESLKSLPKVGHNRTISAEGVISLKPTLVLTTQAAGTKPEVIDQITKIVPIHPGGSASEDRELWEYDYVSFMDSLLGDPKESQQPVSALSDLPNGRSPQRGQNSPGKTNGYH